MQETSIRERGLSALTNVKCCILICCTPILTIIFITMVELVLSASLCMLYETTSLAFVLLVHSYVQANNILGAVSSYKEVHRNIQPR